MITHYYLPMRVWFSLRMCFWDWKNGITLARPRPSAVFEQAENIMIWIRLDALLDIIPFLRCLGISVLAIILSGEAIAFAWEFLTKVLEMPEDRLYAYRL